MRHGGYLEYIDYMLWKALALVFVAFCWGVFCGLKGLNLNGQPKQPEHREVSATANQDSRADRKSAHS